MAIFKEQRRVVAEWTHLRGRPNRLLRAGGITLLAMGIGAQIANGYLDESETPATNETASAAACASPVGSNGCSAPMTEYGPEPGSLDQGGIDLSLMGAVMIGAAYMRKRLGYDLHTLTRDERRMVRQGAASLDSLYVDDWTIYVDKQAYEVPDDHEL